jgi:hypothetical protein
MSMDNGQPVTGVQVGISANNVASMFINHQYHVVGPEPIQVKTDAVGSIKIVERVLNLVGTRLTVSVGSKRAQINPMEKTMKNAIIQYPDGRTDSLILPGTDEEKMAKIASSNEHIFKACAKTAAAPSMAAASMLPHVSSRASHDTFTLPSILVDAGDLFFCIKHDIESGVDRAITFVEDTAPGLYVVVLNIAGRTFHALLHGVAKIAAGVKWVYNAVTSSIKELLKYLEYIFELPEMRPKKQVIIMLIDRRRDICALKALVDHQSFKESLSSNKRSSYGPLISRLNTIVM